MENRANLINLEILRMAKELVTNEYVDHRAQLHNKWLKEAEDAMYREGYNLPYPDIPPYPTEEQVVKRAQTLLNFLLENREKIAENMSPVTATVSAPISESTAIEEPEVAPPVEPDEEEPQLPPPNPIEIIPTGPIESPTGPEPTGPVYPEPTGPVKPEPIPFKSNANSKKNKVPLPPEDYKEYARAKIRKREWEDGGSTFDNLMLPELLKTFNRPKENRR